MAVVYHQDRLAGFSRRLWRVPTENRPNGLRNASKKLPVRSKKPLQAKSSIKEAVEKRLHFDGLKVAAGDREVAVRKAYNCFEL
jgi:hypothetical protein